ncbi:MAG: hypothetical protein IKH75_01390 [Ruminococcus sp.]|nr:hypothetical protein [Ruminococcus sp.]
MADNASVIKDISLVKMLCKRNMDEDTFAKCSEKLTNAASVLRGNKPMTKIKRYRSVEVESGRFEVGDEIAFELLGTEDDTSVEPVEALCVLTENDEATFVLVDCLRGEYPMNEEGGTKGGYANCDLRKVLNEDILISFPEEIVDLMTPFENGDLLIIPNEMEIFGEHTYGDGKEDFAGAKQWEPMKLRRNRIAFSGKNGDPQWYWLRDPASAAGFALVYGNGYCFYHYASYSFGVRPAFKIMNP